MPRQTPAKLRHHHDLPHLLVRLEEPVRLDNFIELERARNHRLQMTIGQSAQDQFLRARKSFGVVPDRRGDPAADAEILERRGPVRMHRRLADKPP